MFRQVFNTFYKVWTCTNQCFYTFPLLFCILSCPLSASFHISSCLFIQPSLPTLFLSYPFLQLASKNESIIVFIALPQTPFIMYVGVCEREMEKNRWEEGQEGGREENEKGERDRGKEEVHICVHANLEGLVLIIKGCFNHYLQVLVSAFDHMILHN